MGISAGLNLGGLRLGVCTSTTRPSVPYEGQIIYETDTDRVLVWNASAWVMPNSPAQNPSGLELITASTCSSGGTASNGVVTINSAVSSVTVANCFNSTYDSYEMLYNAGVSSITEVLYLQLTGITGSNYYSAGAQNTSGSGAYNGIGINAGTKWQIGTCTTTSHGLRMTIHNPFLTKNTYSRSDFASDYTSGWAGGVCNITTSTTGFTLSPGSGTLTGGTITVYGYRK